MWVGGVADSQTRSKPLKTPPNHPENRPFWPEFHLSYSQISQKPWGGWVGKQIWERSPKKKRFFFGSFPKGPTAKTKTVLKSVSKIQQLDSMPNLKFEIISNFSQYESPYILHRMGLGLQFPNTQKFANGYWFRLIWWTFNRLPTLTQSLPGQTQSDAFSSGSSPSQTLTSWF